MSNQRYSPEFKDEAVRQVTQRGYSVAEVADRIKDGVASSNHESNQNHLMLEIRRCRVKKPGH